MWDGDVLYLERYVQKVMEKKKSELERTFN